jgi:hypothetical protein
MNPEDAYEADLLRNYYSAEDTKLFEVGVPHGHTNPMTYDEAMELLEHAPHASLGFWNGHEWEILFDGQVEFIGVQP